MERLTHLRYFERYLSWFFNDCQFFLALKVLHLGNGCSTFLNHLSILGLMIALVKKHIGKRKLIAPADMELSTVTDDPQKAGILFWITNVGSAGRT